jgi:hypothetical protein
MKWFPGGCFFGNSFPGMDRMEESYQYGKKKKSEGPFFSSGFDGFSPDGFVYGKKKAEKSCESQKASTQTGREAGEKAPASQGIPYRGK